MTKVLIRGGAEYVEDLEDALDIVERECGYDLREYIEEHTIDKAVARVRATEYQLHTYFGE